MPFPNITKLSRLLLALLLAGATTVALAQERPRRAQAPQTEQRQAAPQENVLRLLPADAVTEHSADVGGSKLAYTATAGTLSLFDQSGERSAAIFYTAYIAKDAGTTSRPITFVFNGGPGAASAFLNLGAVGPRIVEFGTNGGDGSAARLVDNPDTWLGFTDLVMIDPVGSGWSRAAKPDGGSAFWGVQSDADALAKTIALYLSKNSRSSSPKYILGESYGGFRAAKVARALQREQGIIISGIVMVSPMLEGTLLFAGTGFPLGAALHLPSLAATELERKGTFSKEALAAAEKFALTEYLTTLAGPPPKGEAARDFYKRVAEVSGLPESVIARSRGFIRDAYLKNLRASEGKIVSRYDATFAVIDPYPESESTRGLDPLLDGMLRAYGSAFSTYARDELGFKTEMTYTLLSSEVNRNWDWGHGTVRSTASVSDDLQVLLALSPSFRLLVTHGVSDMTTPYAVSRYVLDHLPNIGDPARAQLRLYRGGHMYYIDAQSRKAFGADAKAFYQEP
jgi:carboxypeptidase C (cathepsin A)